MKLLKSSQEVTNIHMRSPVLNNFLRVAPVAVVLILIASTSQLFPGYLPKVDYQAYWGAGYLLRKGKNSADSELSLATIKPH